MGQRGRGGFGFRRQKKSPPQRRHSYENSLISTSTVRRVHQQLYKGTFSSVRAGIYQVWYSSTAVGSESKTNAPRTQKRVPHERIEHVNQSRTRNTPATCRGTTVRKTKNKNKTQKTRQAPVRGFPASLRTYSEIKYIHTPRPPHPINPPFARGRVHFLPRLY